eukprot:5212022-Amphidinium_carterae.1
MNNWIGSSRSVYVAQVDLSKAFPRLNREKASAKLHASGLPEAFTRFMATACLEKQLCWKQAGVLSRARDTRRGTPQGCALSILAFQALIAPAIRATQSFLHARCASSAIFAYADDIVIVASSASLLQQTVVHLATLLASLDFVVNPSKSLVCTFGLALTPPIFLDHQLLPITKNMDLFGSTVAATSGRLVAPAALPTSSPCRSVQRWIKVKQRLLRLEGLPIPAVGKLYLWRATILPVITYDIWAVLPTKGSAAAWTSFIIRCVFSGIRGSKNPHLMSATNPHQLDLAAIFLHQLAKDALGDVLDHPLHLVFDVGQGQAFHTPLSAFTTMAKMMGFVALPEGLYCSKVDTLLQWPPESLEGFLHLLRNTLRSLMLALAPEDVGLPERARLNPSACAPVPHLTQTQRNFLLMLQCRAHRSISESCCPLCGEPGGINHSIWHCEHRSVALLRDEPPEAAGWPTHFKDFALVLESDNFTTDEIARAQHFMTSVLITRRALQRPIDEMARLNKKRARAVAEEVHMHADDAASPMAAANIIDLTDEPSSGALFQDEHDAWIADSVPKPVRKRRTWDLSTLPQHITLVNTHFKQVYSCGICKCHSAPAARSQFFTRHWNCPGIPDGIKRSRYFERRALLAAEVNRQPEDHQLLDVQWYCDNGVLPDCVAHQPLSRTLECLVCGKKDQASNRLRFLRKHIGCLRNFGVDHIDTVATED